MSSLYIWKRNKVVRRTSCSPMHHPSPCDFPIRPSSGSRFLSLSVIAIMKFNLQRCLLLLLRWFHQHKTIKSRVSSANNKCATHIFAAIHSKSSAVQRYGTAKMVIEKFLCTSFTGNRSGWYSIFFFSAITFYRACKLPDLLECFFFGGRKFIKIVQVFAETILRLNRFIARA